MLEVKEDYFGLLVEVSVETHHGVHASILVLPGRDVGRCLDPLRVSPMLHSLKLFLILVELANRELTGEELWDLCKGLLVSRQILHRKAEAHEEIALVLVIEQFGKLRFKLELHYVGH